jgi:ketosteroid isomerase-like protein
MNPIEAVLAFFDAINQHDVEKLVGLMTEDHVFVDSLGSPLRSRETMRAGWRGYFALCPDYRVSHEQIFRDGSTVAAFGSAGGSIRADKWQTPAAWRIVVHEGLIKEFQVYADNKPVYDILAKPGKPLSPPAAQ